MTFSEQAIPEAEKAKKAVGKNECLRALKGEKLTIGQAVKAKCFDCCGYYEDGRVDCKVKDCPLHPWMPYAKAMSDKPRKTMSEEQKQRLAEGRRRKSTSKAS